MEPQISERESHSENETEVEKGNGISLKGQNEKVIDVGINFHLRLRFYEQPIERGPFHLKKSSPTSAPSFYRHMLY